MKYYCIVKEIICEYAKVNGFCPFSACVKSNGYLR